MFSLFPKDPPFIFCYSQFSSIINLNVGGRHVTTSLSTLKKEPHSHLAAMFSGHGPVSMDSEGRYFIDVDPDVFSHILNYLRVNLLPPADKALAVYKFAIQLGLTSLSEKLSSYAQVNGENMLTKHRYYEDVYSQVSSQIIHYDTFFFVLRYQPQHMYSQSTFGSALNNNYFENQNEHRIEECPLCSKRQCLQIDVWSDINESAMAMLVQTKLRQNGYITKIRKHKNAVHLLVDG